MSKLTHKLYYAIIVVSFLIPAFFFMYLFMVARVSGAELSTVLAEEPLLVMMMLVTGITVLWGYLLYYVKDEERFKNGRAGHLLFFMIVSQIFMGNIFLVVLAMITRMKLPYAKETTYLKKSDIFISMLLIVLSGFSGYVLLRTAL
ncbi:hypothetical protein SAMN05421734_10729 [Pelagirhabdus alkalitolerans]|uniref:Uncharacterized protein n=1 Tax=Pelagirhabdus alkalitolerans TaxID=1612202 RepID=A0A1G6KZV6_9BACI|nr:hypothetical protein [Pelagirhabdus alkalitolerans]SDC35995.1 hypothetical protein SAMN05421734_10729 [Pelagirhabdus alkalitolerans]